MAASARRSASGPLTMLCGYLLLGLQPLPVQILGHQGWGAPWVVMGRFGFGLGCVALWCLLRRRGLRTGNPRLLFWRGSFGGVAVLLYFSSVQLAGAGTATVLNYTYPLWANVFAAVFLGQRPPPVFWGLLGVAIAGVWLIVDPHTLLSTERPPVAAGALLGRGAGLASALAAGAAVLCIKKLRETDESLTIITSFSLVGLLLALPFAIAESAGLLAGSAPPPESSLGGPAAGSTGLAGPSAWLLFTAVGALAFGGHLLFTAGYKHTSVPLGTSLSLTVPVVAAAAGALLLGESLSLGFGIGTGLVLAACAGIAWISAPKADTLHR